MPGMKPVKPTVVTTGVLVLAACAALLSLLLKRPHERQYRTPTRSVHYVVTLLAQEEARPGKVVRARNRQRTLAEYVCVKGDRAVAVVALDEESGKPFVHVDIGPATGIDGKTYPVAIQAVKNIYFVTLKKSARHAPSKVTVPLLFYSSSGGAKMGVTNLNVSFTKIASSDK